MRERVEVAGLVVGLMASDGREEGRERERTNTHDCCVLKVCVTVSGNAM